MTYSSTSIPWTLALAAAVAVAAVPRPADACGCLSPPVVMEGDYAVNQQAEQIVFEVGDSTVTAHVLIRYQGDPAQFAWILPVPNQPELAISTASVFALLDQVAGPSVSVVEESVCPGPAYACQYHEDPCSYDDSWGASGGTSGAGGSGGGGGEPPDGVDVLDMQVVGDYETVTFAAQDAALAVQWLQDNGFVVNDTMTPYMQPYIDAGMVFVAAKLVAGAGIDAIKPLKMTYQGTTPMIPLQLTAVATEPHLTVTAYIYSKDKYFRPIGHPVVELDEARLTADSQGRVNYPMLLARTVDEAGGDAFVVEYAGFPPGPPPAPEDDPSGCCDDASDWCGVGDDGQCQCPAQPFDAGDCEGVISELAEGIALIEELRQNYARMTRLTTRLSAEEMTFDPSFEPADSVGRNGRLRLSGRRYTADACASDILDEQAAAELDAIEDCSAVYCGKGQCVRTADGVGCACDAGYAARVFTDLDGQPSVTCVPDTPPVILDKDVALPDPCDGVSCGAGTCVNLGGFAACACDGANAAVVGGGGLAPLCSPIEELSSSPGAENFGAQRRNLSICFATPPSCGPNGWLEPIPANWLPANGVMCASSMPAPEDLVPPPAPDPNSCDDPYGSSGGYGDAGSNDTSAGAGGEGTAGCACRARGPVDLFGGLFGLGLLGLLRLGRRRPRT